MFDKIINARKKHVEAVNQARENFVSWREIANSPGWKAYDEAVDKKIENIRNRIEKDLELTGEELKRLQLALQVWLDVKRIPKILEEQAKGK